MCINGVTILSIFVFIVLNTIQGQQAFIARIHRNDQVDREIVLEKQQEDLKKIELKKKQKECEYVKTHLLLLK